jgi:hypothetical protein
MKNLTGANVKEIIDDQETRINTPVLLRFPNSFRQIKASDRIPEVNKGIRIQGAISVYPMKVNKIGP